ncbi:hypothetical protein JCGZ_16197 [Jatropha curcas]|uniref:Uncharacterized protein n=1 Tax=Jatropha curcas TaxID=180498 RepID=A0A067K3B6_JATCU|nr:hypothetical protein JCGZ_16197 [Jatropha curcas]
MNSAKFGDYSSPMDLVSPKICNFGALSATGISHASSNGSVQRQRVSDPPGLPGNGGSATRQGAANDGGANGGSASGAGAGAGAGGGGQGGGGGGQGGLGSGAPTIPILLRTPPNQLQKLYDMDWYFNMNREQMLALLHRHWCLYTNEQPRQNVTRQTVWPGFRVIFSGQLDIYDPYPSEEDLVELDFNGDWYYFQCSIERIIVERVAP